MARQVQIPYVKNPSQKSGEANDYVARRGRPMLFQVLDPFSREPLYPVALALHVNPDSFREGMQKTKVVQMTVGGFVEWLWPDELTTLSASSSTGAFLAPDVGLTVGSDAERTGNVASGRNGTIAWERQKDFEELFRSNGMVFDGQGKPVIRGRVMCAYDRGVFIGYFTTFEIEETSDKPYSFALSWEFHIEETVYNFAPISGED